MYVCMSVYVCIYVRVCTFIHNVRVYVCACMYVSM